MDPTRIHLLITHMPVFGLFFGFCVLLFGVLRADKGVKIASLGIIVAAVIGGVIAFQTGEPAEETVEHIAGISHDAVELHEESGELTNVFFIFLGVLSVVALYFEIRDKRFSKQLTVAVLVVSLVTFYFVARTASLGGKIRHTEIVTPRQGEENLPTNVQSDEEGRACFNGGCDVQHILGADGRKA